MLPSIPYYTNATYSRLANDLRMRNEKFEDMLYSYEGMITSLGSNGGEGMGFCEWKRAGEVFSR